MLMTDGEIKEALASGKLVIDPCDNKRIEPCSYDARAGREVLVSGTDNLIDLSRVNSVTLRPGDFALIITYESFKFPLDIAANIGMKSGLARRGIILLAGMQIDPDFEGHLKLGLYNCSGRPITIDYKDPICLIEFHQLSQPAERGVGEFPELKEGRIPELDKAFLRQLETTSLSDVAKDMRSLIQNINTLTTITYKVVMPILIAIFTGTIISLIFRFK